MSLLHLLHRSVVLKFAESASYQFKPEASYAFRLTGVDAMGFLQIQDLRAGSAGPEVASEPYWINKDLVREIHEFDLVTIREKLQYTGPAAKPATESQIDPVRREVTPQVAKARPATRQKSVLKQQKSALN